MHAEAWYERYAWIVFVIVAATGLVAAVLVLVNPASLADVFARFGFDQPAHIEADAASREYVEFAAHWAATTTLGFDLFGVVIAATAFRKGARWAWWLFWYWPAMFLSHFFMYESGFRFAQLAWLALTVAALLATRRKAFATRAARTDRVTTASARA